MVALLGAALAGVLPGNPAGDTTEEAQRQAAIAAIDQVRSRTERMLGKPGATIQTTTKAECGGRLTKQLAQFKGTTTTTPVRYLTRTVSGGRTRTDVFYYDDRGVLRSIKSMLREVGSLSQRMIYLDQNAQLFYIDARGPNFGHPLNPVLRQRELAINPAWEFALASPCRDDRGRPL